MSRSWRGESLGERRWGGGICSGGGTGQEKGGGGRWARESAETDLSMHFLAAGPFAGAEHWLNPPVP